MVNSIDCDDLVLLVGSNPLPNYLSARVLEPKSVVLIYTPATEGPMERISDVLLEQRPGIEVHPARIEDGASAEQVRIACEAIGSGAYLNYTGGTKVMSAHARMMFSERGGIPKRAFYVDERAGALRFDDGHVLKFAGVDLKLTLDVFANLHGIKRGRSVHESNMSQDPELKSYAHMYLAQLKRAEKEGLKRQTGFQGSKRATIDKYKKGMSRKRWNSTFRGGVWLEYWLVELARTCFQSNQSITEIATRAKFAQSNGREFELDIVIARGHRLYVISCTTNYNTVICKEKLFEVAMRARQIGGDLARSSLVTLLYSPTKHQESGASLLVGDVKRVWGSPNAPRVFGLDDVCKWSGVGCKPDLQSLKEWLSS